MKGTRNNLARRRNVLENLIEKPPFRYEKSIPSDCDSVDADANEHVVNISLTGNQIELQNPRKLSSTNTNQRCQTTINLYINDPHLLKKNWITTSSETRSKVKNDIILGKNIPNHVLMKNLLGDLGVKKYTSAPNMSGKQLASGRTSGEVSFDHPSKRSDNHCDKSFPSREVRWNDTGNRANLLYINETQYGDVQSNNIERISEEDEEPVKEVPTRKSSNGFDYTGVNINEEHVVPVEEKPAPLDPLKRFKKRPFKTHSSSRNNGILYRDTAKNQPDSTDRSTQPKRTVPSFRVRTRMVRDVLKNNPEVNRYQLKLMKNHEKILESLRRTDFERHFEDLEAKLDDFAEREQIDSTKIVAEKELPPVKLNKKIDEGIRKQSRQILNGTNRHPVCSIESHGSYEEYKRNLIRKPDGTLCCRNTDFSEDEVWTRSETRNIISAEFIKDKIRRFDRTAARKRMERYRNRNVTRTRKWKNHQGNETQKEQNRQNHINTNEGDYIYGSDNEESITFPRETKNAMTRLMAENSKVKVTYNLSRESPVKLTEHGRDSLSKLSRNGNPQPARPHVGHLTEMYEQYARINDKSNRCWPGVAERVQPLPEENMP